MKLLKNKKADFSFLGNNTLNIIISVLCIIILIVLGVKVFSLIQDKTDIESAESNLNNFISEFKFFIEDSQEQEREFLFLGPENWWISFYNAFEYAPDSCENYDFCACICKNKDESACDKSNKGICTNLKYKWLGEEKKYKINKIPYSINLKKE